MSRKRVFLLCIFLAISAVVDEAESFRKPDAAANVSFLEFTADGNAEEGQAQPSEPIVNTQPLQENVSEAAPHSEESTGGSAEKGSGGHEETPHAGEHDKGSGGSNGSSESNGSVLADGHAEEAPNEQVSSEKNDGHSESSTTGSHSDKEELDLYTSSPSDKEENSAPAMGGMHNTVGLRGGSASESAAPSEEKASEENVPHEVADKNGEDTSQEGSHAGALSPAHVGGESGESGGEHGEHGEHAEHGEHGEHGEHAEHGEHGEHGEHAEHGEHGEHGEHAEQEEHQIYGTIHPEAEASILPALKEKGIHVSSPERVILEIIESAKEGIKGLLKLRKSKDTGKLLEEALEKLNINQRDLHANNNFITLEMYDRILSEMFKILTEMSFYKDGHFYETLGLNKSILNQSLKEIKIKMLRTIGVPYTKLPPIVKNKEKESTCAANNLIISITSKELAQRMAIMFAKWLAPEEYGSVVDLDKSIELNVLCAGAPILVQQWKYYQNMLGFETGNEHAFLNLIDELLVIDKRHSNNEAYSKVIRKIKKSKAFNYCTKVMRIAGNISSIPFNHENNKTPSYSIIGSLGNLVKAHMGNYYVAIANRINSYFAYAEKRNKKNSPLKVVSVCTLLHLTDMLHNCSDEHLKNILDLNTLKLNILNMQGRRVLQPLVKMSFLGAAQNPALKEICEPSNHLVDETLSKLLNLLSTGSHELLAAEVEKRGFDEDYIQEEIKNINESDNNVRDKGEDEVENLIFEDL
uniref:Rhoptry neck protein 4 n=1 Tax=Plasmodium vivax TaxID=5855 RepID=A0A1D6ZR46_PLAVI|nr:rhoptry neck protein 4 [Plasmodium vivax]ANZ52535.1 rhoptry neck protein 4 [Plasmodium vivax]ANZ52540.1 rhoptry neck protein 4 [Plasmodium vivax]